MQFRIAVKNEEEAKEARASAARSADAAIRSQAKAIEISERSASAAEKYAAEASEALKQQHARDQADYRAWLKPTHATFDFKIGIRNSGKTMAQNIRRFYRISENPSGLATARFLNNWIELHDLSPDYLHPNFEDNFDMLDAAMETALHEGAHCVPPCPPPAFWFTRRIASAGSEYGVHGRLTYSDAFGLQHELTWCYRWIDLKLVYENRKPD